MTILEYITPSRMGGAEEYFLRLISNLRDKGHRVIVVTKRDSRLREELRRQGRHLSGVELHGWHTRGKFDVKTYAKLKRLVKMEGVDVIHTHLTTASWIGAQVGRACRVPVVAHIHGADSKTWFQRAHYLLAVAEGVKKHLVAQGIDSTRIPVLYYGIDVEKYRDPLPLEEAKAKLGFTPNTKIIGLVGSLIERKGHRHLLNAMKAIEPSVGPVHALFAGEGAEHAALEAQAKSLGIAERVHFLGFRKDAADIMAACDVVTLPSYKEGLSLAISEAMALGRPVIATNVAGMPELVRHNETGLLISPGSESELASALARLYCRPEIAQRLAQTGREFVMKNFDQRECLDRVERFLYSVQRAWKMGERLDCNQWAAPENS